MRFDLTTFIFQIINFVVLLYILKRLLYKPVREIIEKRRGMIEKTVEDAEQTKREAIELRAKYEEEMTRLEDLREQTLEELRAEAMEEKKRLLDAAEEEAGRVIEREKAVFDGEKTRLRAEMKDRAMDATCIMASNLLKDISDEELHKAVYRRLMNVLNEIAPDLLKMAEKDDSLRLELASAYPLGAEEVAKFSSTLESLVSKKVVVNSILDENLIAGARMKAYDRVYNFSLSGQIDLFRRRLKETL